MEPDQAGRRQTGGGIVLRILGVLILAVGVHWLVGLLSLAFPVLKSLPTVGWLRDETYILGIWVVRAWPGCLVSGIYDALFLFAGFQLLRLRRSGWIVSLLLLGYASLSVALWVFTDQFEKAIEAAYAAGGMKPFVIEFALERHAAHVERVNRLVAFFLLCHFVPFLYLLTEWRRFLGRLKHYPSRLAQSLKVTVGVAVIGASALWTFWGAQHLQYRRALKEARSAEPQVTEQDMDRLSPRRRREVTAIFVRRLVAEQTHELAQAVLALEPPSLDICLLTAEDIPSIIAAARSDNWTMQEVCCALLPSIATPEAEKCLMDTLAREEFERGHPAWDAVRRLRPSKVPEALLHLAVREGKDRDFFVMFLGYFRDPRVLPVLLEAICDEDPEVRVRAVDALENHPGGAAERALQEALEDEEIWIRGRACWSLRRIGTATSVPLLIGVMKGPDDRYQYRGGSWEESLHEDAASALAHMTDQDFGSDARKWTNWWRGVEADFDLQGYVATRLFTPLPPPPDRRTRTQTEEESHPHIRAAVAQGTAIRAIEERDMRTLAPALARYLQLPVTQAAFPYLAARVLSQWGYREGIEWMIEFVDDDTSGGNRMFAIETLGRACKVNFFSDRKRWRQWWEANKERFPSALGAGRASNAQGTTVETRSPDE